MLVRLKRDIFLNAPTCNVWLSYMLFTSVLVLIEQVYVLFAEKSPNLG